MLRPALYLFVNKGLRMSAGKIAAQVAQAVTGTLMATDPPKVVEWWRGPGHHHAVYVMEARDTEHIGYIERYLNDRGYTTYLMIDEGMTEIDPITPTVLGVEIVDKEDEDVAATFSIFKLYKEPRPVDMSGGPYGMKGVKRRWWLLGARA